MKAGLVGLPGAGKSLLFRAITRSDGGGDPWRQVQVPDARVDRLGDMYTPKKLTYARFDCHDFPGIGSDPKRESQLFASLREMDALALVIRGFADPSYPHDPEEVGVQRDVERLLSAFQVSDFVMVENRIERLEKQVNKPTKTQEQDKKELVVLRRLQEVLEGGGRIEDASLASHDEELIRGFRFLTQKPCLVILNLPDDGEGEDALRADLPEHLRVVPLRGNLEAEIAQLDAADARAFMDDFGIAETARDVLVRELYTLLGLQSFLTAGPDECRAWTIHRGEHAVEAAGVIHSDIQRGFIRAEVVAYGDLVSHGGFKEAKAKNLVRLEGKDYVVQDGDVINFRFSV